MANEADCRHQTANGQRESCGNAGAVESMESKRQAFPSFPDPLGNRAKKRRRDSHIPTAPTTTADGKVETQNQVSPLSHRHDFSGPERKKHRAAGGLLPSARRRALRA